LIVLKEWTMIPVAEPSEPSKLTGAGYHGATLGKALSVYFADNGFSEDAGYTDAWVDFHLGPIPFPFPNTASRKRALPFHDLHHLVTGYRTDIGGEFQISAWEIGSGCRDFVAAWQLNLAGMGTGAVRWPLQTWRAFLRGRQSKNFYGRAYDDALLSLKVADARRELGLDRPLRPATATDVALYVLASVAGIVSGVAFFVLCAPLAVVAWPVLQVLRRGHAKGRQPSPQGVQDAGVKV
jgi:hypothetical protein